MTLQPWVQLMATFTFSLISLSSAQDYNSFRSCLIERGIGSRQIVQRGNSRAYGDLNYQFRQNPPQITPLAYVLPTRESHIVGLVQCGRRWNIRVIARSGGHQYEKYAYGDGNSVVIDLRRMGEVSLNSGAMLASVGAGAILGPMTFKLWSQGGVFFPIGLCPMVGIGGLAPAGGHGYFTRNFGLTTDYIQEMNIVTGEGTLLTVNNSTNSDLFWALRGGGGASFGIITRFVFRVITPPPRIFEGVLFFSMNQFPQVFDSWQRFFVGSPRKVTPNFRLRNGGIEIHFFDSSGTSEVFLRAESRFPRSRNRTMTTFKYPDFIFYTATNFGGSLKPGTVLSRFSDLENLQPGSSRTEHIKTKSFFVPRILSQDQTSQLYQLFKEQPKGIRCRFEGYGGAVNDVRESETAFVHRRQNGYNARGTVDYSLLSSGAEIRTANRWLNRFFEFGLAVFDSRETYQNYPDADMRNYLDRYYGRNLPRLIQVKRRYDPQNYFRNPQSIPTRR